MYQLQSDKFNHSLSIKYEHYVQNCSANHSISNLVISNLNISDLDFLLHFVHSRSQTAVFTQQSAPQGRRLANLPHTNGAAINQMVQNHPLYDYTLQTVYRFKRFLVWGSLYIRFHELHVMDFGNDGTCVLYIGKLYMTSL